MNAGENFFLLTNRYMYVRLIWLNGNAYRKYIFGLQKSYVLI